MHHLKLPITGKVGEVPPTEEKFAPWSGSHGYYPRESVESPTYLTEKQMKGTFTTSDLITNKAIVTQMYHRNKSQVEAKGRNPLLSSSSANSFNGASQNNLLLTNTSFNALSTTLKSRTNVMEQFIDHRYYLSLLKERGSIDTFEKSFHKFLKFDPSSPSYSPSSSSPGNGTRAKLGGSALLLDNTQPRISLFDIDLVVKDSLGEDIPGFILDKLKILGNSVAIHGEVTWKDFVTVIDKVTKAVEAECAVRHDQPGLLLLMNQPRIVDKKLGALGDSSTTYRDNFNQSQKFHGLSNPNTTSNSPATTPGPVGDLYFDPPKEEIGGNLNNAAKILCAGTTKGTYHIPGYRGHVPMNVRNIRKAEHASGKVPHPVVNDLVLTQRNMGCVLGYTGYVPIEFNGQRQERKTSCDPRTSNGAAYSGTKALL